MRRHVVRGVPVAGMPDIRLKIPRLVATVMQRCGSYRKRAATHRGLTEETIRRATGVGELDETGSGFAGLGRPGFVGHMHEQLDELLAARDQMEQLLAAPAQPPRRVRQRESVPGRRRPSRPRRPRSGRDRLRQARTSPDVPAGRRRRRIPLPAVGETWPSRTCGALWMVWQPRYSCSHQLTTLEAAVRRDIGPQFSRDSPYLSSQHRTAQ